MKKIVSFLASLALVFGTSAALPEGALTFDTAISASALTYGDYEYTVLSDGTAEITNYIGNGGNVVIPKTLNGKKVTSLADESFSMANLKYRSESLSKITAITVPDTVTNVGMYAFSYLKNLKEITFPDTITEIPSLDEDNSWGAFEGCTSLEKVKLPKNLKKIENKAFYSCSSLKEVELPETVTDIEWSAFAFCTSLENIKIPENVKAIEQYAFCECSKLKSIIIPKKVTQIGDYALGYDSALNKMNGFTIYGYSGTAAEEYANNNGFTFIPLDEKRISGDATGDGKVNIADVIRIQQKLAGWKVTIDESASDVTGDGKVNIADVIRIQQKLAGWKVTLK